MYTNVRQVFIFVKTCIWNHVKLIKYIFAFILNIVVHIVHLHYFQIFKQYSTIYYYKLHFSSFRSVRSGIGNVGPGEPLTLHFLTLFESSYSKIQSMLGQMRWIKWVQSLNQCECDLSTNAVLPLKLSYLRWAFPMWVITLITVCVSPLNGYIYLTANGESVFGQMWMDWCPQRIHSTYPDRCLSTDPWHSHTGFHTVK